MSSSFRPAGARGARVQGQARLGLEVVGDGERDPLERRDLQTAVAQLRAEPRVGAQHRRRAGDHAEEVGELAARGQRATKDRHRALGRGEVVVDLKSAHRCLHQLCLRDGGWRRPCPCTSLWAYSLPYVSISGRQGLNCAPRGHRPYLRRERFSGLKDAARGRSTECRRYGCAVVSATMQQKMPEQDRPHGDPVRPRAEALQRRARRPAALHLDEAQRRHRAAGDLDRTALLARARARSGPASSLRGVARRRSMASRRCSTSAHHERASACWDMRVCSSFSGLRG